MPDTPHGISYGAVILFLILLLVGIGQGSRIDQLKQQSADQKAMLEGMVKGNAEQVASLKQILEGQQQANRNRLADLKRSIEARKSWDRVFMRVAEKVGVPRDEIRKAAAAAGARADGDDGEDDGK